MNKGYIDFSRLHQIHKKDAFFVIRAKDNLNYRRLYSRKIDKSLGLIFDQTILLETPKSKKDYTEKLRLVKYYDNDIDKIFFLNQ